MPKEARCKAALSADRCASLFLRECDQLYAPIRPCTPRASRIRVPAPSLWLVVGGVLDLCHVALFVPHEDPHTRDRFGELSGWQGLRMETGWPPLENVVRGQT